METLFRDVRYAARRILASPGFSLIAVLSIALGVGANSAIFTLVSGLLLQESPYGDPERLVHLYPTSNGEVGLAALSYPEGRELVEQTGEAFEGVATTSVAIAQETLSDGSARTVAAEVVSGNYFDILSIQPLIGRTFLPEEDQTLDTHPVAVLHYRYWQSRFGGEPQVIGKSIRLSGIDYTIIGVMPEKTPVLIPGFTPAFWAPSMMSNHLNNNSSDVHQSRGNHSLFAYARLRQGVGLPEAQGALDRFVVKTREDFPDYSERWGMTAIPTSEIAIHPMFDRILYPASGVLLAIVGMVLLVACVNLASFLLARATDRKKEIAVRLALGASRWQLVRQLLTETVLLSLAGGVVGLGLALWILRMTASVQLPSPVPMDLTMSPDLTVLVFTLVLSLAAGLLFGLVPALQTSKPDLAPTIKNESVVGQNRSRFNLRNALIVAQVTISFVLLIGSGLFLRSLQAARDVDPGFGTEPTAIGWIGLSVQRYDNPAALRFFRQVVEKVENAPGVEAVGLVDNLALGGTSFNHSRVNIPGVDPPPGETAHQIDSVAVDSGYFDAAGVDILSGRAFSWSTDLPDGNRVMIISKAMAEKFWPGEDAVGKTILGGSNREYRVVGVAADTNVVRIGEPPRPYIYRPLSQDPANSLQIIARTQTNPKQLANQIVREAQSIDPDILVIDARTMDEHLGFMLFPFRVAGTLLSVFGILTIVLASIGLYGVVSYSVAGRRREVGLRISLGAIPRQVVTLLMRDGVFLVLIGSLLGLGLALLAAPVLQNLLFGIEAIDIVAFFWVGILMLLVGAVASLLPAARASRIDPIVALRSN